MCARRIENEVFFRFIYWEEDDDRTADRYAINKNPKPRPADDDDEDDNIIITTTFCDAFGGGGARCTALYAARRLKRNARELQLPPPPANSFGGQRIRLDFDSSSSSSCRWRDYNDISVCPSRRRVGKRVWTFVIFCFHSVIIDMGKSSFNAGDVGWPARWCRLFVTRSRRRPIAFQRRRLIYRRFSIVRSIPTKNWIVCTHYSYS